MNNLTTLMKRLEAVTARLEDIAAADYSGTAAFSVDLNRTLPSLNKDLVASQAHDYTASSMFRDEPESLPEHVEEFDDFLRNSVGEYVTLSNELGGVVAQQATAVLACFQEQRRILLTASQISKPDASGWQELLRPMSDAAARVVEIQEASHGDSLYSHVSCVADGIPMLGWIKTDLNAFRRVDSFLKYAEYFGNKVMKEHKERDPKHVQWVRSYYQIFQDLSALIKEQFPLGISWHAG